MFIDPDAYGGEPEDWPALVIVCENKYTGEVVEIQTEEHAKTLTVSHLFDVAKGRYPPAEGWHIVLRIPEGWTPPEGWTQRGLAVNDSWWYHTKRGARMYDSWPFAVFFLVSFWLALFMGAPVTTVELVIVGGFTAFVFAIAARTFVRVSRANPEEES